VPAWILQSRTRRCYWFGGRRPTRSSLYRRREPSAAVETTTSCCLLRGCQRLSGRPPVASSHHRNAGPRRAPGATVGAEHRARRTDAVGLSEVRRPWGSAAVRCGVPQAGHAAAAPNRSTRWVIVTDGGRRAKTAFPLPCRRYLSFCAAACGGPTPPIPHRAVAPSISPRRSGMKSPITTSPVGSRSSSGGGRTRPKAGLVAALFGTRRPSGAEPRPNVPVVVATGLARANPSRRPQSWYRGCPAPRHRCPSGLNRVLDREGHGLRDLGFFGPARSPRPTPGTLRQTLSPAVPAGCRRPP